MPRWNEKRRLRPHESTCRTVRIASSRRALSQILVLAQARISSSHQNSEDLENQGAADRTAPPAVSGAVRCYRHPESSVPGANDRISRRAGRFSGPRYAGCACPWPVSIPMRVPEPNAKPTAHVPWSGKGELRANDLRSLLVIKASKSASDLRYKTGRYQRGVPQPRDALRLPWPDVQLVWASGRIWSRSAWLAFARRRTWP